MNIFKSFYQKMVHPNVWARPKMQVTFRAELMPGKSREERTFQVETVLRNRRVILSEFPGEYRESQFEPVNFKRETPKPEK